MLGICLGDDADAARQVLEEAGSPFPSAWEPGGWEAPIAREYGVIALPSAVLVGADGKILQRRVDPGNLGDDDTR